MEDSRHNKYQFTSHLYDLDERQIVKDDLPFYLEYANQVGGEILEMACGTGRITMPLAKAGFTVTGFDLSPDMVERFQEKLMNEEAGVRSRVHLFEADMTAFELKKQFPLIIVPFRAFQLLVEDNQQIDCLRRVHEHLSDDGLFIINVFKPHSILDETWVQPEQEDWVRMDVKSGYKVRRTNIKRRIDIKNQITYPELLYYVEDQIGNESLYIEKLAMKYFYEEQLRNLLLKSGFEVVNQYGYYDRRPISEGPELIFVCKRTNSIEREEHENG